MKHLKSKLEWFFNVKSLFPAKDLSVLQNCAPCMGPYLGLGLYPTTIALKNRGKM
jgi:hypothetical protein